MATTDRCFLASERQLAFIHNLLHTRLLPPAGRDVSEATRIARAEDVMGGKPISSGEASLLIDYLKTCAYLPKPGQRPDRGQEIEPGLYVTDDGIVKVQQNKAGTRVYAMVWVDINGERLNLASERVKGEWRFEPGLIAELDDDHRMTVEQAKRFTLVFGQCARCGRRLKAAQSVEDGIGPVCIRYFRPAKEDA